MVHVWRGFELQMNCPFTITSTFSKLTLETLINVGTQPLTPPVVEAFEAWEKAQGGERKLQ